MQHVVLVAHPAEQSFTMSLARAYAAELETLGHRQRFRDLYRMGFNPLLAAHELGLTSHPADADVAEEQGHIRSCDALTAIYPLWWLTMPAMMKGYIDRVFARGFAYETKDGVIHGLLSGRKCVLITVSGAPLPLLVSSGNWNAVQVLQDTHIFRSAGFDLIEHLHFDEVRPGLPTATIENHIARVRASARQHFSPN